MAPSNIPATQQPSEAVDVGDTRTENEARGETGRGRGRGRGGRDRARREAHNAEASAADIAHEQTQEDTGAEQTRTAAQPPVLQHNGQAHAIVSAPAREQTVSPMSVAVDAPVASSLPPTTQAAPVRFELPLGDLHQIVQAAGLQWVNSDADKVRATLEAMAREPKAAHVPRVITAAATVDEGPLVLVETKRDLHQVKLPFETEAAS